MKKVFLFIAMITMSVSGNAQSFSDDDDSGERRSYRDKRQNVVSLGIKAGANFSTMSKYDDVDLGLKSGVGFEAGAVIAAHFGKRTKGSDPGTGLIGVQLEPSFVQHTIKTNTDDIKLSYFEVPILLKIYVTPNFNIEVGPNLCGTLSASPDYIYQDNVRIATGDIKGFDVKACVGASYEMKNGLYGSLRYNLGTSEVAKNFSSKVSAISVSVGYKFNIFKF